ncbi:hypothetical protein B0O80DRAFT_531631 [Mortierella sp. GBAus27b]|nr:hypothetical protein B0O80DRAFT_531631 [Mortierella sp. GBAus27b]
MNISHVQEFRIQSSLPGSTTKKIPTRFDKTTGQHVVLWKHIQLAFKDAECVMMDDTLVPFMTDDDGFEDLEPLRIPIHPGTVLDVVVPSIEQHTPTTPIDSMEAPSTIVALRIQPQNVIATVQQITNVTIAAVDAVDKRLAIQSAILNREEKSLQQYNHLNMNMAQWNMGVLEHDDQISPVDDYIKERHRRLSVTGIQEDDLFQIHTLKMLQQMLDKQQQTLNHQAVLENRVQALMTQNYELHEYPIPRLFVVLPRWTKRKDKIIHPLSKQFRLHFLCECGDNTIHTSRGSFPNKIHLARHEGYDIDQPNEFFKQYGSYVLAVLKFLKFGVMAAGVAVPPLALFKVVDSLDAIQKSLASTVSNIGSLMDETIKHIHELQGNIQDGSNTSTEQMRMEDIEALEGADLRQLQLYLNDKDKGRILGDLFRTFTPDGHVKWVCIDHYKENYRKVAMQHFKDVIAANGGHYYTDSVYIELGSSSVAKQFYEAMIKARGVQRLVVTLGWDVTLDDLCAFASAVTKANITTLHMVGFHSEGPILDMINSSRRYNPILELMCNGRIQEMRLQRFHNFYQHIDVSSMETPIRLQKLNMKYLECPYQPQLKPVLKRLLKHSTCLIELDIEASDLSEAFEDSSEGILGLPCLEKMTIKRGLDDLNIEVSQGKIRSMEASVELKDDLYSHYPLLRRGYLTKLTIRWDSSSPGQLSTSQLTDMIRVNAMLEHLILHGLMEQQQTIMDAITSTRSKVISERGACRPLQLSLHLNSFLDFTTSYEFPDCSAAPNALTSVRARYFSFGNNHARTLLQYGSLINILETNENFDDEMAMSLDKSTEEAGSKLSSIKFNPESLTTIGLECMERVIYRSRDLQQFNVSSRNLHEEHQHEKMEKLIRQYGRRLNGLKLRGSSPHVWIPKVMAYCPSRTALPELETFTLGGSGTERIPPDCVRWIASMLSTSPLESSSSSVELAARLTRLDIAPTTRRSSMCEQCFSRTKQVSINLDMHPEVWEVVIRALDYSSLNHLRLQDSVCPVVS